MTPFGADNNALNRWLDPDIKGPMRMFRITVVLLALTGSAFAGDVLSDTPENRALLWDLSSNLVQAATPAVALPAS